MNYERKEKERKGNIQYYCIIMVTKKSLFFIFYLFINSSYIYKYRE